MRGNEKDLEDIDFDICVADVEGYSENQAWLQKRKIKSGPVVLPIVGLLAALDNREVVIERFDEIIHVPSSKSEMKRRIEALIKARQLALQNQALQARLSKRVVLLEGEASAFCVGRPLDT